MQTAAASGEKDKFPLGPQLFFAFSPARGSGLGARIPSNLYSSVSLAPSFILFLSARGSGLGARIPSNPYSSVSLAPSSALFSSARGSGLGARILASPYSSVSLAPSSALFSLLRGAAYICITAQIICSILCTWLIFYCISQTLEYNIVYQNNLTVRRDCRLPEGRELPRGFKGYR